MHEELADIFRSISNKVDLSREQARWVFKRIMTGELDLSVIGALLAALATKGESVQELVGAAEAMRAQAVPIRCERPCIDTCGTGGDGVSTFNVSTTAAIIAAACGAIVAKHGNRSTTRVSGSTEALTELGIDVDAEVGSVERSLREVGIAYLNAQKLHPAMKFAAPVRKALPIRTIFNLLGPLTNPAGARRQILGVPQAGLLHKMSSALLELGAVHAWVVNGEGLCDLTITGTTKVAEVKDGNVCEFEVTPESVGLKRAGLDELRVATPSQSAKYMLAVLEGELGPRRDHTLLNSGGALVVAGKAESLQEGIEQAAQAIDDGGAMAVLQRWRTVCGSQGLSSAGKVGD